MKINYFAYCLSNSVTGDRTLFDLRPFLRSFESNASPVFKNQFRYGDENLYLVHIMGDCYYFVMTRNGNLAKKINKKEVILSDIKELMDDDEELGFASYVNFYDGYFSYASTLMAPKHDAFVYFINSIIEALGDFQWKMIPEAILHQATKDEVLKMDYVGRSSIELDHSNGLFKDWLKSIGIDENKTELGSIEVTFKPKNRSNIRDDIAKVIEKTSNEHVSKFVTRAKDEGMSTLVDLHLVGRGAVSDFVDVNEPARLLEQMQEKHKKNGLLASKVAEYKKNGIYTKKECSTLMDYSAAESWSDLLSNLQPVSE